MSRSRPSTNTIAHTPRRGFTLIEMLVSLFVIIVALGVVATVFQFTTQTAGRAQAIAEVETYLRDFEYQFREDLSGVDPGNSILVMVGRTQAAALTVDFRRADQYYRFLVGNPNLVPAGYRPEFDANLNPQYSNPRADLLMFYTNRAQASEVPAPNPGTAPGTEWQRRYAAGAKGSPVQVVYGHAALGDVSAADPFANQNLRHIERPNARNEISPVPLVDWHLARRTAILESPDLQLNGNAVGKVLLLNNELAALCNGQPLSNARAGDVVPLNYGALMAFFEPNRNPGQLAASAVLYSPYRLNTWPGLDSYPGFLQGQNVFNLLTNQLYVNANPHHFATVLPEPPLNLRSNLAVHQLPGCIWFQVEFLMPEDPRNSATHPDGIQRSNMPRWCQIDDGETYLFVPDSSANRALLVQEAFDNTLNVNNRLSQDFGRVNPGATDSNENRIVRTWPYAIRVTVKAIDHNARLPEPITRSFVYRFE